LNQAAEAHAPSPVSSPATGAKPGLRHRTTSWDDRSDWYVILEGGY
jgi:hypothetical protein